MKVAEFLNQKGRPVITARAETRIREAMSMLIDNKVSCLPVVNDQIELVGIVSDKDIFRSAFKNPGDFIKGQVGDLMTTELIVGLAEDDLDYIAGLMTNNRIRHVPIVENKQLKGLVSVGDIVKSRLTSIKVENRYLKKYIEDAYPG